MLDAFRDRKDQKKLDKTLLGATSSELENMYDAIKAGAYVNARTPEQDTVLHLVVNFGRPKEIIALIESGADLHARNASGDTPLMSAVRNDHLSALPPLLALEQNKNILRELIALAPQVLPSSPEEDVHLDPHTPKVDSLTKRYLCDLQQHPERWPTTQSENIDMGLRHFWEQRVQNYERIHREQKPDSTVTSAEKPTPGTELFGNPISQYNER